jgi:MFS transporter, OFA family, oxalate/formate antiporter
MKRNLNRFNFSPFFPFNVAKWPFFYGWIILGAGVFGVLMSLPGQTTGISAFTEDLITNYKINRLWFSVAYFIGTTGSGLLVRYAGRLYDKSGARPIAIAAALVLAITLCLLSQLDRIVSGTTKILGIEHYSIFLFLSLSILFFFLRFSGQGVTTLIARNMVMKWFESHRGLANSLLGTVTALGFNVTPKFFNFLIELSDWRTAWLWMAGFLILIFVPFIVLIYRDNPQTSNLTPDGSSKKTGKKRESNRFLTKKDFTIKEARKTREFWLFASILALLGLFFTGFTMYFEDIFRSQGLTKDLAMNIFIYASIVSIIFQLTGNILSDYISLRYYLPVAAFFTFCNMIVVPFIKDGNIFYYVFIFCLAINTFFFGIFITITWPRLFGTKHLGEIAGSAMGIVVTTSALGPLIMSLSNRFIGSYAPSFYLCAAVGFIIFIFSFTARDERTIQGK